MKIVNQLLKEEGAEDSISARTLLVRFDRAKNKGVDPTSVQTIPFVDELVAKIYPRYRDRLRREHAVDFNDLLLRVLDLTVHEEVGPKLHLMFRHVLVDEFQDTNKVQYRIVSELAAATRNVTVVGDDDQSIYGWRGAEPRNLFDFERDFPETEVIRLEQNYRSTSVILDAANAVIARNLERHPKTLWTDQGGGDPIEFHEAGDDRGEAWWVADKIRRMLDDEARSPDEIAILYRTHALSRQLEEQLLRVGVRVDIVGGVGFYERREVKDVLAYLRLLVNPAADSSFERVVNTPARGLGDVTIDKVRAVARARQISLLEASRRIVASAPSGGAQAGLPLEQDAPGLPPAARKKLAGFVQLMDGLAAVQQAGASLAELAIQVVERSRYREVLEAEDSQESRDRLANLAELVTVAADFDDEVAQAPADAKLEGTVTAFLERLALATPGDVGEVDNSQKVRLTTIHAAKGLEFLVVFICGLEDGLFPSLREREDQDEAAAIEEERRLAYVAMTRARERLILTGARVRRVWGEMRAQTPSRFLDDVPGIAAARRLRSTAPPTRPFFSTRPPPVARKPVRQFDEHDQRSHDDDEPTYDLDGDRSRPVLKVDRITPGARVHHVQFGDGRVVDASGEGKDRRLVIEFPGIGHKTVLARFVTVAT
jgi:DNA helicase-2/ATP-dependent DNA helicase PcrA